MAYDSNFDVVKQQKRRRLKSNLKKLVIFLLIAGFCSYLYIVRDAWVPKLEGIGSRYEAITQNDGTLAEGNFPLSIARNATYQAAMVEDTLMILNGSYLYLYSLHGDVRDTRQLAYTNPILKTNENYALIYESDGTKFRVDRQSRNLYTKSLENPIITGAVSSNGTIALVTESDLYSCVLMIFDKDGKKLYTRNCVERVSDIAFTADGTSCVFTELSAADGEVTSSFHRIRMDDTESIWKSEPMAMLSFASSFTSDETVCVIGDTACAYYNAKGELASAYSYTGQILQYAIKDGNAAILIRDEEKRETKLVLFHASASDPIEITVNGNAKYVQIYQDRVYMMNAETIIAYNFSGKAVATVNLDSPYDSFLKKDGYLFLLRYDKIDRVDFKE